MGFRKTRIVKIRWTSCTTGNDKVPDTDTVIYLGGAERVSVMLNTNPLDTLAPDVDLHTICSNDLVNYGGPTSGHWQDGVLTAQAKDVINFAALTLGPRAIKLRLDVNTNVFAGVEYAEATVFIDDMSPGGRTNPTML
jgi:hypothetical protein